MKVQQDDEEIEEPEAAPAAPAGPKLILPHMEDDEDISPEKEKNMDELDELFWEKRREFQERVNLLYNQEREKGEKLQQECTTIVEIESEDGPKWKTLISLLVKVRNSKIREQAL